MSAATNYAFLQGGGEMGALTRNFDWSKTPLGTPDQWPQSLRTTVSLLLNSQFPMFIWWGKELTTIYNDAYRSVAGDKHPALLGKSGREAWSEIWDDLSSLVEKVFSGSSTWSEDLLLNIKRQEFAEETFFTFSYSPVLNESGAVGGLFCACIETTEKVISKRKLEESERNLRNTILQAPVAMCILKGENNIVEIANDRMISLWGAQGRNVVGNPLFRVVPEVADQGFEALLNQVYTSGETYKAFGLPVITGDGKGGLQTIQIDFVYEAYREPDSTVSGIIVVAIDVTEKVAATKKIEESEAELQRRVEERTRELAIANKELQRSNANLEEFAHAASHDLKEPIRKIHFFTAQLKDQLGTQLNETQVRSFNRIEKASQRMANLIDDLLLYSHVSQRPLDKEAIDLREKLQRVLEDLELDIAEKKATVNIGKMPVIQGYRRQLQQLFQNLISNALKYSKAGVPPVVDISATTVSGKEAGLPSDKNYSCIRVTDNGIGFPQEYADRIFQMFQRLHGRTEYEGTGVGLSIAKKVVENHGGKIVAEGEPGKGASFCIYLPID